MNPIVERACHYSRLPGERQFETLHTEHCTKFDIRLRQLQCFELLTSNKHLAVAFASLFSRVELSYLLGVLVLSFGVNNHTQLINVFRTMSEGRRTVLQALPLSTSPARSMCETLSASDEA